MKGNVNKGYINQICDNFGLASQIMFDPNGRCFLCRYFGICYQPRNFIATGIRYFRTFAVKLLIGGTLTEFENLTRRDLDHDRTRKIAYCKTQTADCRLQTSRPGGICRLTVKCRLDIVLLPISRA